MKQWILLQLYICTYGETKEGVLFYKRYFVTSSSAFPCCCLATMSSFPLWDPMDCRQPGSSVPGISQARILEWVAISFSRGSSQPRNQTHVSCMSRQILYHWATWEVVPSHVPPIKAWSKSKYKENCSNHLTIFIVNQGKFFPLSDRCDRNGSHLIQGAKPGLEISLYQVKTLWGQSYYSHFMDVETDGPKSSVSK